MTTVINAHTRIPYKEAVIDNFKMIVCIGRNNLFRIISYSKNICYHYIHYLCNHECTYEYTPYTTNM